MAHPGLRVEALPELGRTLVAARAFAPYEVVLSEAPLLSWSGKQGGASFLDAAAAAPADVVAALLDFARPALDDPSPRVGQQKDAATKWLAARDSAVPDGWTAETAHALLLVADTNTHSFAGSSDGGAGARLALFALASKAAHSCAPNCLYSSRSAAGTLRYVASRAIAEGEAVTFSYLADEQASPRAARRAQLLATKHFLCRCTRCAGRDDCRGLRCGACAAGTLLCADAGDEAEPSAWACASCGAPPARAWLDAQLRAEAKLLARHELLHKALRCGEALRRPPDELAAFCALAAGALAPTHWLFAAGAQLRITWAASQRAALVKSLGAGRPGAPPPIAPAPWGGGALVSAAIFSATAGAAGMELLRCCECIAAGCVGGASCTAKTQRPHPPAAGATHVALWAVQDLRASGTPADAETARGVAPRYLPLMRAQCAFPRYGYCGCCLHALTRALSIPLLAVGEDDDDVRSIAAWFGSS